jgi:hypothetical protein
MSDHMLCHTWLLLAPVRSRPPHATSPEAHAAAHANAKVVISSKRTAGRAIADEHHDRLADASRLYHPALLVHVYRDHGIMSLVCYVGG